MPPKNNEEALTTRHLMKVLSALKAVVLEPCLDLDNNKSRIVIERSVSAYGVLITVI